MLLLLLITNHNHSIYWCLDQRRRRHRHHPQKYQQQQQQQPHFWWMRIILCGGGCYLAITIVQVVIFLLMPYHHHYRHTNHRHNRNRHHRRIIATTMILLLSTVIRMSQHPPLQQQLQLLQQLVSPSSCGRGSVSSSLLSSSLIVQAFGIRTVRRLPSPPPPLQQPQRFPFLRTAATTSVRLCLLLHGPTLYQPPPSPPFLLSVRQHSATSSASSLHSNLDHRKNEEADDDDDDDNNINVSTITTSKQDDTTATTKDDDWDDATTTTTSSLLSTTTTIENEAVAIVDNSMDELQQLLQTWRTHPSINPTIAFPTWICGMNNNHNNDNHNSNESTKTNEPPAVPAVPPKPPDIQSILQSPIVQPYLATHHQVPILQHLTVRFKVVRNYNSSDRNNSENNKNEKISNATTTTTTTRPQQLQQKKNHSTSARIILLRPGTPKISYLPTDVQTLLRNADCYDNPDDELYTVQFQYHQFTANYLLNQLLPQTLHPVPTSFETVGHVAHLNLKSQFVPYRTMIGEVFVETIPNIELVIQKIGTVSGPHRTFPYEIIASSGKPGKDTTGVELMESGVSLHFDLQHVYWCSRLSEERQRLLQNELLSKTTIKSTTNRNSTTTGSSNIIIADVFCGVGALCIQAAMANSNVEIWANDWNPSATNALHNNAIRNGILHQVTRLTTVDAYTFLMDLGMTTTTTDTLQSATTTVDTVIASSESTAGTATSSSLLETESSVQVPKSIKVNHQRRRYHRKKNGKVKENQDENAEISDRSIEEAGVVRLPNHVVMNFPLEAPNFLGALRWWPTNACGDGEHSMTRDDKYDETISSGMVTPRIHVYTFARNTVHVNNHDNITGDERNDDEFDDDDHEPIVDKVNNDRSVEDIAVDLVADNLLPQLTRINNNNNNDNKSNVEQPSIVNKNGSSRRQELNDVYNCNVHTHIVRDVAPGKVVVCVSFTVTSKLLRHMRGDFL